MINDYSMMGSLSFLWWKDKPVTSMTVSERTVCYTLMKAYPNPVKIGVILDRLGSESMGNVADVHICRIRKKLREVGSPNPILPTRNRCIVGERAFMWVP